MTLGIITGRNVRLFMTISVVNFLKFSMVLKGFALL